MLSKFPYVVFEPGFSDPYKDWLEEDLEDLVNAKEYLVEHGITYEPDPLLAKHWIGEPSHMMMFNIRLNKELAKFFGQVATEELKYTLQSVGNTVWSYFVVLGYLTPLSRLTPSVNFVDVYASITWDEVTI